MEQLVLIGLITGIVLLGMAILAVAVLISSRKCSQRIKCKNDNLKVQDLADDKYSRPYPTPGKTQKSCAKIYTGNEIKKTKNTIEEVSSTVSTYSISHIYDNDSSSLHAPRSGETSLRDIDISSEKNIQREISFLTDSFPSETGNRLLLIEAEVYGRPVSEQTHSEAVRESSIYLDTLHIPTSQDISRYNKRLIRKESIPVEERATVQLRESVCSAEDIRGNRDIQEEVKSFSRDSSYDNNWENRFYAYDNHIEHLPSPESDFVESGLQNIMRISETEVKTLYTSNSKSLEVSSSENDNHMPLIDTSVYVEPVNAKSRPGPFRDRENNGDKRKYNPDSNYANIYEDKHGYLVPNNFDLPY